MHTIGHNKRVTETIDLAAASRSAHRVNIIISSTRPTWPTAVHHRRRRRGNTRLYCCGVHYHVVMLK